MNSRTFSDYNCYNFFFSSIIIFCTSIFSGLAQNSKDFSENHPNVHKVVVDSVLQTSSYTYLLVKEENKPQWLAIPKREAAKDEIYYFQGGIEMRDFKSRELKRMFASILFLEGVISPLDLEGGKTALEASSQLKKSNEASADLKIDPAKNGISIAELFINKHKYENKIVKIKGQVAKYNSGIMKRNWIHLKDGSQNSSDFDFTATSVMDTKEGEIIVIEGKIVLDKDFGSGYFFSVLMEDGKIIK